MITCVHQDNHYHHLFEAYIGIPTGASITLFATTQYSRFGFRKQLGLSFADPKLGITDSTTVGTTTTNSDSTVNA